MSEIKYATEADLCAAFIDWAKPQGWTAYPECCGWDILMVKDDGTQLGIQAKLRANFHVLSQAVPDPYDSQSKRRGPDYRAVLVQHRVACFREIALALRLEVYHPWGYKPGFCPDILCRDRWQHGGQHALPRFVPDVVAGASSPVQLTEWKIAALEIVATLEVRGFVTTGDFKRVGIDRRRWMQSGWLKLNESGQYIAGQSLGFKEQHPRVYGEMLAEVRQKLATDGSSPRPGQEAGRT